MTAPDRPSNVVPFSPRRPRPVLEREHRARRHADERTAGCLLIDDPRAPYDDGEPVADGSPIDLTEIPEPPKKGPV